MSTKYEYNDATRDSYHNINGANDWGGQSFTPQVAHTIKSVKLQMARVDSPGTVYVGIKAIDGDGKPTGDDLCSGTTNGNTLGSWEWREITLGDGAALEAGVEYFIIVHAPGAATGDRLYWGYDSEGDYPRGQCAFSTDGGVNWNLYPALDNMFEDWGDPIPSGRGWAQK